LPRRSRSASHHHGIRLAGFIFSPGTGIAQIGFTLAIGVLLGAFLVRMTLIPAAFAILGRATWWAPRWLLRILPDLDIEGHRLGRPESRCIKRSAAI